jgi:hypothetical protein
MNAEEMIEYVLAKGDGRDRDRLDGGRLVEPAQAAQLERLRLVVERLLDDGSCLEHPPGLASRTVAFVARNRRRPLNILDHVSIRLPFRWADFAVAASIFIAGLLTLLPAIHRSRERMNQAGCVFNLQQLGSSLAQYASLNPFLPYPPADRSDAHTGMFAVMLHDAGVLNDLSVLDCPCNGPCPHIKRELASFEQVDRIRRSDPELYNSMLCWDYAYNVGYRHSSGRTVPAVLSSSIPVIADSPDHDGFFTIREGNSPNHRRRGQNVLFGDGAVRWFRTRKASPVDPDIYLNNNRQAGPGVEVQDAVLLPSKIPFRSR